MFVLFPPLRNIFAVLYPCASLQAPFPKCSLFPLPPSFWPHILTCLLRPLVLTVFQLPLLCSPLFLASLLSQPSNTWSTAPRPSFKPHEFLSGFLLQSSTASAQWLSPSRSRFKKKSVSLIPVSTPKSGATEALGKIWTLGGIYKLQGISNPIDKRQEIWS